LLSINNIDDVETHINKVVVVNNASSDGSYKSIDENTMERLPYWDDALKRFLTEINVWVLGIKVVRRCLRFMVLEFVLR